MRPVQTWLWVLLTLISPFLAGQSPEPPKATGKQMYAPGEVLVILEKEVGFDHFLQQSPVPGLEIKRRFETLSRLTGREHLLLKLPETGENTEPKVLDLLNNTPGVQRAELNVIRKLARIPNDPMFYRQWSLKNTGAAALVTPGTPGADIGAESLWDRSVGSPDIVVAVIDTGVDYRHPDLAPNMWRNPGEIPDNNNDDDHNGLIDDVFGYDFAANGSGGDDADPMDCDVHGTHVAGVLAAAGDNGTGVAGVCWKTKIMAVKAFRPTSPEPYIYTSDEIQAFEYIIKMKTQFGVNIAAINCSYSGETESQMEKDIIRKAGEAGMVICAAMGNDGKDIDASPQYPASFNDLDNVIAVAATSPDDSLADFSNYGVQTGDLAAPGLEILSSAPLGRGDGNASLIWNNEPIPAIAMSYSGYSSRFTQPIIYCGQGLTENDFPVAVSGKIALIERGGATFSQKTKNAMLAGARAVVIFNNQNGPFMGTLETALNWPPVLSIAREDGLRLINAGAPALSLENIAGDYLFAHGTSMATPMVSGAFALLADLFPNETWRMSLARILLNLHPLPSLQNRIRNGGRLSLRFPSLQGPLALTGKRIKNQSLFLSENLNYLSWRPNPQYSLQNQPITGYRVYLLAGKRLSRITSMEAGKSEYVCLHRNAEGDPPFVYAVTAVTGDGSESEPSLVAIN